MAHQNPDNRVIVLIQVQSQYDVLGQFTHDLCGAFQSFGRRAEVIDIRRAAGRARLDQLLADDQVALVFGMNGAGYDLKREDESLYNVYQIPFMMFLVDHPLYHVARIEAPIQNLFISVVDEDHVSYIQHDLGKRCPVTFLPHAVRDDVDEPQPIEARTIDVLFAGTYERPDTYRQHIEQLNAQLLTLFDDVVEAALYTNRFPSATVLQSALLEAGFKNVANDAKMMRPLLHCVDKFVRLQRRQMVIERLRDVNVVIYGAGWNQFERRSPHHTFYLQAKYTDIQERMKQAKLVLNSMPRFTCGGHERLFETMRQGAVGLCDSNRFLETNFTNERDILFYDLHDVHLSNKVVHWLGDAERLQSIANKGREHVLLSHTWRHRARQILQFVGL